MHLKPSLVRRFFGDSRAVAAVEFALVIPALITLYFGTVEAASVYTADRRVATVASTIADLVSRHKDQISKSNELDKYLTAASMIMYPAATTDLTQRVSLLSVSSTGVAKVLWSYGKGIAARDANSSFTLAATTSINQLARNKGFLVVSEVTYPYKPTFGLIISKTIQLVHTEYFLPRYENTIALKN